MTRRHQLLAVSLVIALASPAGAFDLTGTWTGTRKCKFFAAGVKAKVDRTGNVRITQDGNAVAFDTEIGSVHLYSGVANFSAEKPDKGELSLVHCRNHVDLTPFDAVGRFTAKTKPGKVKATISGFTVVADEDPSAPNVGTCKWKLTRIDLVDPVVPPLCDEAISRRAAKKDVAYLDAAAAQRLHDELMRYRLATYAYARAGTGPGSRLGLIIDDVEPSPAIAANGNRVDLYAYTSMAVAALQTQAREIERLKQAVAALESRAAVPLPKGARSAD